MRRSFGLLAIAASVAIAPDARAQPSPNPDALKHFLEGKRHRDEHRCDLAIPELEASIRVEPSIGAYYNLGVCFEETDKRLALVNYKKALGLAKERQDEREREIRAQLSEFLEKTPHIRLALPQPVPSDLAITVDGEPIPAEDLQTETKYFVKGPKDSYAIVATAAGFEPNRFDVGASAVTNRDLVQVVLRRQEEPSATGQAVPPPAVATEEGGWSWQHYAGLGVIGIGAIGVTFASASAIAYNIDRVNLTDDYSEVCPTRNCPDSVEATRIADENNANENSARRRTPLWLATGIGGVLAIGGGILLFVTAPRSAPKAEAPRGATVRVVPALGARQNGLSVVGTF